MDQQQSSAVGRVHISKETISRLVRDIKELIVSPLSEHGIYYKHDEEDMLKGYALIVGPEDTPYFAGYYLFEILYPTNYPYSPPTVKYCTNNGIVRFNPNLYINGKVCISILNTWRGEQWTSCQTVSTILLSLSTLLCKSPLMNEPGCRPGHKDEQNYIQIVEFANIDVAICDIFNKHRERYSRKFDVFTDMVLKHFGENYENILAFINKKCLEHGEQPISVSTTIYNMHANLNYNVLRNKLLSCHDSFVGSKV